jgi:ParB-like chromosome segregation protein Spo0J
MHTNAISKVPFRQQLISLRLEQVNICEDIQIRAETNEHTIKEYSEAMERGDTFPPIQVVRVGQEHVLADGRHRFEAAKIAGRNSIEARVVIGTKITALEIALKENLNHGLRLTSADKRRAIKLAAKQWPDKSNREIARLVGCSDPTVADVKQSMLNFSTDKLTDEEREELHRCDAIIEANRPQINAMFAELDELRPIWQDVKSDYQPDDVAFVEQMFLLQDDAADGEK